MPPLPNCDGRAITTIEGLEHDGRLHPLQQAFLDCGAMQCGYCTAGMIMSGVSLLERNHTPSSEEAKRALEGNVCRCGTYPRILAAVHIASETMKGGRP